MMTNREAIYNAMGVIERVPYNFLATIDFNGEPDVRTMMNLRHKETYPTLAQKFEFASFNTYIPVNTNSGKVMQVRRNPKASLYYTDTATFESVLVLGEVEIVQDDAVKNEFWRNGWEVYFPGGKDGGEFMLMHFKARKYKYYDGKQNNYESNVTQDEPAAA